MRKYRGFNEQALGVLRSDINGGRTGYFRYPRTFTTNKITPTEPSPILQPIPQISPGQQEIEYRQYQEGGDGTANEIERTAKIDEAMERIKIDMPGFSMFHPDDISSSKPIQCMRTNPDVRTIVAMVCTPNQAYKDMQKAKGLKDTIMPVTAPTGKPNLLPLALAAGAAYFFFM